MNELPDDERFALERSYCLLRSSYVARESGEAARAILQAEQAQKLLATSPFRSELQDLTVLLDIAESYSQAGRMAEAIPAFERASAVMNALGRGETQKAGTLYNNWALSLDTSGRPADAEPIYRRAIDISRTDATAQSVSPMLQINYGRTLGKLERFEEAVEYAESGYEKSLAAGFEVVVNQSLLLRASLYRQQGDLDRAAAMLDQVEPRLRAALPPGHLAFGSPMLERALIAQAQNEHARASELVEQVYQIAEKARIEGGVKDLAPRVLVRRAEIGNSAGRHAQAAADARLALQQYDGIVPSSLLTSLRGDAWLALGHALRAQGEETGARTAFASALKHLESALGRDHTRVHAVRALLDGPQAPATATSAETGAGSCGSPATRHRVPSGRCPPSHSRHA